MTLIDHTEHLLLVLDFEGVHNERWRRGVVAMVTEAAPQLSHPLLLEGRDADVAACGWRVLEGQGGGVHVDSLDGHRVVWVRSCPVGEKLHLRNTPSCESLRDLFIAVQWVYRVNTNITRLHARD